MMKVCKIIILTQMIFYVLAFEDIGLFKKPLTRASYAERDVLQASNQSLNLQSSAPKLKEVLVKTKTPVAKAEISTTAVVATNTAVPAPNIAGPIKKAPSPLLLTLRDVDKLGDYVLNLQAHIKQKVFGDLENFLLIHKMEGSFQAYSAILDLRKNYYENREQINRKVLYIKAIVEYAYNYTVKADPKEMEDVIVEDNIDIDRQNQLVLIQLLTQLKSDTNAYADGITRNLRDKFNQIDVVHRDQSLTDNEKIAKLIDLCLALINFGNDFLNKKAESIIQARELVVSNPKYGNLAIKNTEQIKTATSSGKIQIIIAIVILLFVN